MCCKAEIHLEAWLQMVLDYSQLLEYKQSDQNRVRQQSFPNLCWEFRIKTVQAAAPLVWNAIVLLFYPSLDFVLHTIDQTPSPMTRLQLFFWDPKGHVGGVIIPALKMTQVFPSLGRDQKFPTGKRLAEILIWWTHL